MKPILYVLWTVAIAFTDHSQSSQQTSPSHYTAPSKVRQDQLPKEKVKEAKRLLLDAKKQLTREGKYSCCTQEPCNQCQLDHQSCPCEKDIKAGKPVCPECYGGWLRGEGKVKNIKPSDVKTEFSGHKH